MLDNYGCRTFLTSETIGQANIDIFAFDADLTGWEWPQILGVVMGVGKEPQVDETGPVVACVTEVIMEGGYDIVVTDLTGMEFKAYKIYV